jgi:hypothetical protein
MSAVFEKHIYFLIHILIKTSPWGGCTNQIPSTIKPYPMKYEVNRSFLYNKLLISKLDTSILEVI